jgi:hypothetical protein
VGALSAALLYLHDCFILSYNKHYVNYAFYVVDSQPLPYSIRFENYKLKAVLSVPGGLRKVRFCPDL